MDYFQTTSSQGNGKVFESGDADTKIQYLQNFLDEHQEETNFFQEVQGKLSAVKSICKIMVKHHSKVGVACSELQKKQEKVIQLNMQYEKLLTAKEEQMKKAVLEYENHLDKVISMLNEPEKFILSCDKNKL